MSYTIMYKFIIYSNGTDNKLVQILVIIIIYKPKVLADTVEPLFVYE